MSMYAQFAAWYDRIFPFSPGVYAFLTHSLPEPAGPVLDLGCGTGDYCAAFSRDGVRAVGVDLDAAMIGQARLLAPDCEFHVRNMLDFATVPGPWNMIYSIGNTPAHLPHEDFWTCVHHVAAQLRPGGVWIMQVMNWDCILGLPEFTFPPKIMDNAVFQRRYADISATGLTFQTSLDIDGHRVFADSVRLYPMTSEEICAGHAAQGLRLVRHVADYAGSGFDPEVFSANIFVFRR